MKNDICVCVCVCVNFLMGREGRKNIGGYLVGRDVGSKELREQTLRSPVSQRVDVTTRSEVCTEGE